MALPDTLSALAPFAGEEPTRREKATCKHFFSRLLCNNSITVNSN